MRVVGARSRTDRSVARGYEPPTVARTRSELDEIVTAWRRLGQTVALVPTMGALHRGHLELVRRARELADRVIVSIFVNPTQFGPNEDFAAYPRDTEGDLNKLAQQGIDLAWMPDVAVMYPKGFSTEIIINGITADLCGAARPGHFTGVATVVAKLLLQTRTDIAVFGEKDYQQLQVIRRLTQDLDIHVRIVAVPTVREADGLALSSRNAYLSENERRLAGHLPRILQTTVTALETDPAAVAGHIQRAKIALRESGIDLVEYLELRDAATLLPLGVLDRPARLLAAIRVGRTRLIDNMPASGPDL